MCFKTVFICNGILVDMWKKLNQDNEEVDGVDKWQNTS